MRVSLVYPVLLSVPPGLAVGVGTYMLTGGALFGLGFGLSVWLGLFVLVLLGTEVGSTDRTP